VGVITLPSQGVIYIDTQTIIYTVQRHPVYASVCRPLWQAAKAGQLSIISSDLTLMEALVMPVRNADTALVDQFRNFLLRSDIFLQPITQEILESAASLRAQIPGLKTPDALHAATALLHKCALFVTNDKGFRRIPGLSLAILDDILASA